MSWAYFTGVLRDRFVLKDLIEDKAQYFIKLRKSTVSVKEYGLNLTQLSRYTPHMVADLTAHNCKFLFGVSDLVNIE